MNPFLTSLHSMPNVPKRSWSILLQTVKGASRSLLLCSGFWILVSSTSPAQQNINDQDCDLITLSTGKYLRWYGYATRSYFVQLSDTTDPLRKWKWAPIIEGGNNAYIQYIVDGTGPKVFFRLKYTNQVPGPGETLDTADFDQDGISNLDEIVPPPPLLASDATDPLDPDTDHDGMTDGYERDNDLDPNNPDTDGDGLTDLWEFQHFGANGGEPNEDSDGDGFINLDEQTGGTNPVNPASHPPGTPLPGGRPLLVGEQVTSHGYRWGTIGFQNPAKSYNTITYHWVTTDQANNGGGGDRTFSATVDSTANWSYTDSGTFGSYYSDGAWTINSDVSRTYIGTADDGSGDTCTIDETLSDEYTIPAFTANVESWLPAYQNRFTILPRTASIFLTPATDIYPGNEYGITKLQYKWRVNAGPNQVVTWLEVFTPTDSTPLVFEAKSWTPGPTDTESPVYEIDPTTRNGRKNGVYTLLPVEVEIKRGGLGTNLPPPALPQAPVLPAWQSQGGKIRDLVSVWDAHTSSAQVADLKGDWMQARVKLGGLTAADLPPNFVIWLIDGHPAPAPNTLETPRLSWPGNFGVKKVQVTIGGEIFKVFVDVPNVGTLGHVDWGAAMVLVHGPLDGPAGAALAKSYGTSETAWSDAYAGKPSVRNALRHSSWIAHCASLNLINPAMADLLGKAHEYDNFSSGNNWAYEATMDLHNNAIGATCIHSNFLGFPDTAAIRNDVTAKLAAGELWIWDSAGLEHTGFKATMKSNDLPINP